MKMKSFILILFLITIIGLGETHAQYGSSIESFELRRQEINQSAMLVLGSWALGNMLVGGYGHFTTSGQTRDFHQFNVMWNVVNLGIAAYGYYNAVGVDASGMTGLDVLREHHTLQNILLLNIGLNVTYMTAGLYLRERSKNVTKHADRFRGYGNSLLLQGGFLFLFDVSLFLIHRNHAGLHLFPQLESLAAGGAGLGLLWRF